MCQVQAVKSSVSTQTTVVEQGSEATGCILLFLPDMPPRGSKKVLGFCPEEMCDLKICHHGVSIHLPVTEYPAERASKYI